MVIIVNNHMETKILLYHAGGVRTKAFTPICSSNLIDSAIATTDTFINKNL